MEALRLHRAESFLARLLGLHRFGRLSWHTGLYIAPCRAIHTFGLRYAIDVVFLDGNDRVIRKVDALAPGRWAVCAAAVSVVELPAGYCAFYPDYENGIRQALYKA